MFRFLGSTGDTNHSRHVDCIPSDASTTAVIVVDLSYDLMRRRIVFIKKQPLHILINTTLGYRFTNNNNGNFESYNIESGFILFCAYMVAQ